MPNPVTLVTVHHEGAGAPAAPANIGRCAHGGYTYGFGSGAWQRFRDVWSSYATLNFNHVSLDLVLTGNRMDHAVTDADLASIRAACADARALGYVVGNPTVRAHQNSPGSSTACPGSHTMARWGEVAAACTAGGTTPPPTPPTSGGDDVPKDKDFVAAFANADGAWRLQYDGGVQTIRGRFYGSYFTLPANVRNDPARRFLAISAAVDGRPGYTLHSVKGEAYTFNTPQ
jgi:hypothetical protein